MHELVIGSDRVVIGTRDSHERVAVSASHAVQIVKQGQTSERVREHGSAVVGLEGGAMFRRARLPAVSFTGSIAGVAVGLALAFAGAASAQSGFQASVTAKDPAPKPCPNGEFLCGTADVANYGDATWTLTLTSLSQEGTCDSYAATVTFQLTDSSTLVLDEDGAACGPGQSNLSNASSKSFGHPGDASGHWTVQSADRRFAGLTGGGTDGLHLAGAATAGTYSGSLG